MTAWRSSAGASTFSATTGRPASPSRPRRAASRPGTASTHGLGRRRLAAKRYHLAAEAFLEALDRNPDHTDALIGLGSAQFELRGATTRRCRRSRRRSDGRPCSGKRSRSCRGPGPSSPWSLRLPRTPTRSALGDLRRGPSSGPRRVRASQRDGSGRRSDSAARTGSPGGVPRGARARAEPRGRAGRAPPGERIARGPRRLSRAGPGRSPPDGRPFLQTPGHARPPFPATARRVILTSKLGELVDFIEHVYY